MTDNKMKAAMAEVLVLTNSMSEKEMAEGIAEALNGEHRTLQQTFFRVFVSSMEEYGKNFDYARFDARNAESVKFAKDVSEMETYFPFI